MRDVTPPPFRDFAGHWAMAFRAAQAADPSSFAVVLATITATATVVGLTRPPRSDRNG